MDVEAAMAKREAAKKKDIDFLATIAAVLFPPLSVSMEMGTPLVPEVLINVLYTLLGWVPGCIHAFYIIARDPALNKVAEKPPAGCSPPRRQERYSVPEAYSAAPAADLRELDDQICSVRHRLASQGAPTDDRDVPLRNSRGRRTSRDVDSLPAEDDDELLSDDYRRWLDEAYRREPRRRSHSQQHQYGEPAGRQQYRPPQRPSRVSWGDLPQGQPSRPEPAYGQQQQAPLRPPSWAQPGGRPASRPGQYQQSSSGFPGQTAPPERPPSWAMGGRPPSRPPGHFQSPPQRPPSWALNDAVDSGAEVRPASRPPRFQSPVMSPGLPPHQGRPSWASPGHLHRPKPNRPAYANSPAVSEGAAQHTTFQRPSSAVPFAPPQDHEVPQYEDFAGSSSKPGGTNAGRPPHGEHHSFSPGAAAQSPPAQRPSKGPTPPFAAAAAAAAQQQQQQQQPHASADEDGNNGGEAWYDDIPSPNPSDQAGEAADYYESFHSPGQQQPRV